MSILSNLINKITSNQQTVQPINPQGSSPLIAGLIQATTPQNISPVVSGINKTSTQGNAAQTQSNSPQAQSGANKIINAINNVAPSNWNDKTRQRVLMASQFLSGFGATPYDPNSNFMGNLARGISNASNAAYKQIQNYGNYKQVKNLYDQMGYDSSGLSPMGDYSKLSPSILLSAGAKMKQNQIKQEIQNTKDKTTRTKMIFEAVNKGFMSPEEGQMQLKALDFDTQLQESNETRRTNSQINVNSARITKINADIQQNAQKIQILRQKVAQGAATANDKAILNQLNIENKKLLIEQNRLINEAMKEQIGEGGNNTPRPVGGSKNGKTKVF